MTSARANRFAAFSKGGWTIFSPPSARIRSFPTDPSSFRASEGRRSHLHQRAQPAQVVGRGLRVQMQRRPSQADAAQRLATHLVQTCEHMLHAGADLGNALVASLLAVRQRLASLALALDVHPPASCLDCCHACGPSLATSSSRSGKPSSCSPLQPSASCLADPVLVQPIMSNPTLHWRTRNDPSVRSIGFFLPPILGICLHRQMPSFKCNQATQPFQSLIYLFSFAC